MKTVVHINYSDSVGGASIAVRRLSEAMQRVGILSYMLVIDKSIHGDKTIVSIKESSYLFDIYYFLMRVFGKVMRLLFRPFGTFSFPYLGFRIHNHPLLKSADYIYIHWTGHYMLSLKEIRKILQSKKPVFWVMHDQFPTTGGCHHVLECNQYKVGCQHCPYINILRFFNPAKYTLRKKVEMLSSFPNLHFIAPSSWIAKIALQSFFGKGKNIQVCRNLIDISVFKPTSKPHNTGEREKIIMFIACNINDIYKGWKYLIKALQLLDSSKYKCLVIGDTKIQETLSIPVEYTGYLDDSEALVVAYNRADVYVVPSLCESFSQTTAEAMACGIPCVGFDCTAIPELIKHKETGYLAKYRSSEDLASGIKWICEESDYEALSKACREHIVSECSYENVLKIHPEINLKKV